MSGKRKQHSAEFKARVALAEAGAEIVPPGRVRWVDVDSGQMCKSPSPICAARCRARPGLPTINALTDRNKLTSDPSIKRPAVQYPGGKWRIAEWIVAHLPPHGSYGR